MPDSTSQSLKYSSNKLSWPLFLITKQTNPVGRKTPFGKWFPTWLRWALAAMHASPHIMLDSRWSLALWRTLSDNPACNLISMSCFQLIFSCSAGYFCSHRNNSWSHSARFSVVTGCLLHSILATAKMLTGSFWVWFFLNKHTSKQTTKLLICKLHVLFKIPWSSSIQSLH